MKIIVACCFVFVSAMLFSQQPNAALFDDLVCNESKSVSLKEQFVSDAFTANYNIIYQRCQWKINPDTLFISGSITSFFIPTENNFQQIQFDCSDSLIIDSIKYHNTIQTLHQPFKNILKIDLPLIPISTTDSVTVFYHGTPASNGFGSFVKDQHNGSHIIYTLSEPYGAMDWWPCKQSLTDKIDSADFYITTPDTLHAGCNGLLIDSVFQNGNVTWHWQTHYPIATYLVGFAVTNYQQFQFQIPLSTDTVSLLNYVFPEYYAQAQTDVLPIVQAMKLYDSILVTYPFANEKYGHMQFTWHGGMEHQTMSSMYDLNFELVVHEMAHQWFGDKVTCASWHDIWLNEGFATYLTDLCYEYMFNGIWWNTWKAQTLARITSQPNGSVYCDDTTDVSRIFNSVLSYRKGSYLLHMLRWELGDDAFFTGLKNYLNDTTLAYGFATTANLQQHLEQACNHSLNKFFVQWFYNEGWPSYHVEWQQGNDNFLHIRLTQTPSDSSVRCFQMHVPLLLHGKNTDSLLVIDNTSRSQLIDVPLDFKIDSVFVDPNMELISANNTVNRVPVIETGNDLMMYPNPVHNEIFIGYNPLQYFLFEADLYDMAGRKVIHLNGENISPSFVKFDISNVAAGNYILFLPGVTGGEFKVVKL